MITGVGEGPGAGSSAAPALGAVPPPAIVAPLEPAAPDVECVFDTGVSRVGCAAHVQSVGQSVFEAQVVALGWQYPGKVVVVVQVWSGGTGAPPLGGATFESLPPPVAGAAKPVPVPLVPLVPAAPVPAEPEHEPLTVGMQLKPAPQSVSALHGSCHVNAQCDVFTSVHVGWSTGTGFALPQSVLGAQGAIAVPPVHLEYVSVWQTMFGPHSLSDAHSAA
jgi:hypothetical protein